MTSMTTTHNRHQPKTGKNMKPQINNRPFAGLRDILITANKPNVHMWKEDGVDHINLGMGTTRLGANLSLSGVSSFKHSRLGRFKTLFGFWNYIANVEQDDRYRVLNDKEIRAFNRQKDIKRTPRRVRNFIAIILDAQWQRITGNDRLFNAVKESTLPFDCYKLSGDVRERTSYEYWFVPAMEEMRKCIKEGKEFNVRPYMQDRGFDLYVDLIANPAPPIPTAVPVEESYSSTDTQENINGPVTISSVLNSEGYFDVLPSIDSSGVNLDDVSLYVSNIVFRTEATDTSCEVLQVFSDLGYIKLFDPNQSLKLMTRDPDEEVMTIYSDELGRIKADFHYDLNPNVEVTMDIELRQTASNNA